MIGLPLALSACLFGDADMLESLAGPKRCPFTDNMSYTGYSVANNPPKMAGIAKNETGDCHVTSERKLPSYK